MSDSLLERFVDAQAGVFETALSEISAGRKRTHWMWFVFPQLSGLGRSVTAQYYGLSGIDEARAYLAHAVLGDRLRRCVEALLQHRGKIASDIFAFPDDAKLLSCLTLFEAAATSDDDRTLFGQAADRLCGSRRDGRTLSMLGLDGQPGGRPNADAVERLGAVRNPSKRQLVAMIGSSSVRAVRRITCERTGDVWCWPAERANHAEGARILGAEYTHAAFGELMTLDD